MSNKREWERVVVTSGGLGVVSPLGNSITEFERRLFAGENGIRKLTRFDQPEFEWFWPYKDLLPIHVAGQVEAPDLSWLGKKAKKAAGRLSRFATYSVEAAKQSLENVEFTSDDDPVRASVVMGNGAGGLEHQDDALLKIIQTKKGPTKIRVPTLTVPKMMNHGGSAKIAELFEWGVKGGGGYKFKMHGHNYATTSACASSLHAMGVSFDLVRSGRQDLVLTGGAEASITPSAIAGFYVIKALTQNSDPDNACKPFDKNRDGFVMSEGAASIRFESLSRVKRMGREDEIIAEVAGYGATCDASHDTAPNVDGDWAYMAMRLALEDAGLFPEQVEYVNAHGTSTPYNDKIESLAIIRLYGKSEACPPISSTKSAIGHTMGAAGAFGAIAGILALKRQEIPPTINYKIKDPDCDLDYVPEARKVEGLEVVLVNSFGFGGVNASLVFQRYDKN